MNRRCFLGGSLLVLAVPARAAEAWILVTPDEVTRDLAAPRTPAFRNRALPQPGAPAIVVEQPTATLKLHPPLTFRVRFVPAAGTTINPNSFRATYGFLGIDITSRLLEHARVNAEGLEATNVAIPAGDHRVTLSIADLRGRENSQQFQFTVE